MTQFIELTELDGTKIITKISDIKEVYNKGVITEIETPRRVINAVFPSYENIKKLIEQAQANDPLERIEVALEKIAKDYHSTLRME